LLKKTEKEDKFDVEILFKEERETGWWEWCGAERMRNINNNNNNLATKPVRNSYTIVF
jgi:hypothetical protein